MRGPDLVAVWVLFLGDLVLGAGFLLSARAGLRSLGLAMIGAAALALAGLTLWYYVQNRRRAD